MSGHLAALGLVSPYAVAAAAEYDRAVVEFGDEVCEQLMHASQATGCSFAEMLDAYVLAVDAYAPLKEAKPVEPDPAPVAPARVRHRSGNGYRPGPDRGRRRRAASEGDRLTIHDS